jgi:hypothetical protein
MKTNGLSYAHVERKSLKVYLNEKCFEQKLWRKIKHFMSNTLLSVSLAGFDSGSECFRIVMLYIRVRTCRSVFGNEQWSSEHTRKLPKTSIYL